MDDGIDYLNEVRLRGRVSADPEERELPSGDRLVTLRLVVSRPDAPARVAKDGTGARARVLVDTFDLACWSASARRSAARCAPGDVVDVEGSLRRRFFRGGTGSVSRYEVEVRTLRRVRAPVRAAPAS